MIELKIATTDEQSKRLLDCGIDPNTADMCYDSGALSLMKYQSAVIERDSRREKYEINPAWSLSSLLELIPQRIMAPKCLTPCDFILHHHIGGWTAMYHDNKTSGDAEDYMWQCVSERTASDPIEACVMMIEWLQENLQFKLQ